MPDVKLYAKHYHVHNVFYNSIDAVFSVLHTCHFCTVDVLIYQLGIERAGITGIVMAKTAKRIFITGQMHQTEHSR